MTPTATASHSAPLTTGPWRVLPAGDMSPAWALHTAARTRDLERQALAATAPHALMARAGLAVARLALALWPHARRVLAVAGPGNNGGDALVAARWLHERGLDVRVALLGDPLKLPDDARWALAQAQAAGVPIELSMPARIDVDGVLDGLIGLGGSGGPSGAPVTLAGKPAGAADSVDEADHAFDSTGLAHAWSPAGRPQRPITGLWADAIERMNAARVPVLSIDLPSGLEADRGTCAGPTVVAAHTLCLLTLKPGLFTAQGRDHAGVVWLDTLGVTSDDPRSEPSTDAATATATEAGAVPASTSTPEAAGHAVQAPALHLIAAPNSGRRSVALDASPGLREPHASHKGRFGDVAVVGGAPGMGGAAALAARAALAAGAGRVFLASLDPGLPTFDPLRPELMLRPLATISTPAWLAGATVVAGCGGGEAVGSTLAPLLMHAARLLLDADALNAIACDPGLQRALAGRAHRHRPSVLTPHPLEAARLLSCSTAEIQADRIGAARELAARYRCVAILKGSGTIVASPDGPTGINPTGNARLASAGTGDVLAGWLGGTWSRAVGGDTGSDPSTPRGRDQAHDGSRLAIEAAHRAVFLHGLAAERAPGHGPLLAADLIEAMRVDVA